MFKSIPKNVHFPEQEEQILQFWEKEDIFQKSIENREQAPEYIIYDGPPFATGLPHFGHFIPSTVKDVFPRYKTMTGYKVHRRFGWDTHGLPIENYVEKELGLSGKVAVQEYGLKKFNQECRKAIGYFTQQWESRIKRLGRWVDFEHGYKTMDLNYMESVWNAFYQLYQKNLVYQGYYILPYSPKLGTPLSNFEVNLGEYKPVHDPAITVKMCIDPEKKRYILIWTTTPWTLPSNMAIACHEKMEYVEIFDKTQKEYYILAQFALEKYFPDPSQYELIQHSTGQQWQGQAYQALFPYFEEERSHGAFQVYLADFVEQGEGTGFVHIAPGFGEQDYELLKNTSIYVACPVDQYCCFIDPVTEYKGIFVKQADKPIIENLQNRKLILKKESYLHRYPFCYRSQEPLIYRAVKSWYIQVSQLTESMVQLNDQVHWQPAHLQKGRFGKWLAHAKDWAISRNRFWGNPIPIWQSEQGSVLCIGSLEQLEQYSGVPVQDMHRETIDQLEWDYQGQHYKRIEDVFDCWFESGCVPYAQVHYPFENTEQWPQCFPADFISEGIDQTRGWFYTLFVIATALENQAPFKNVLVNGLVLDSTGKKMSKSQRNFTDPMEIIASYGADTTRLYLLMSSVVYGEDLKFDALKVKDVMKTFILPIWNAYSFFVLYAQIDHWPAQALEYLPQKEFSNPLDTWILSLIEALVEQVRYWMDQYQLHQAIEAIGQFIDQLNNWYIRRSRRRFWKADNDEDKDNAYIVLYYVLRRFVLVGAPFIPFICESIYQNLKLADEPISVHLCDFPVANSQYRQIELEEKMALTQKVVSMARHLRNIHEIKNRQPLKELFIISKDQKQKNILYDNQDVLKQELNIKTVSFSDKEQQFVDYQFKLNYKVVGKKLGAKVKLLQAFIEDLSLKEWQIILDGGTLNLSLEGQNYELTPEDVVIHRLEKGHIKLVSQGSLSVALDIELDQQLILQGQIRDFIRFLQNQRKEQKLQVNDHILLEIWIDKEGDFFSYIQENKVYLQQELLADQIQFYPYQSSHSGQVYPEMEKVAIQLSKVDFPKEQES